LAVKSGLSVRTIKRKLAGKPAYLDTIQRIASALGTTPDALIACEYSDSERRSEPRPVRFRFRFQLQGSFTSAIQRDHLVHLSTRIVNGLLQDGVQVKGHGSTMVTSQFATNTSWRVLLAVNALTDERPSWLIAAIKPPLLRRFLESNTVNSSVFPFGEVILSGWGEKIPRSGLRKVAALLECRPNTIIFLSPS
jgi:transcriptional regulator with XRE-family HTH domain